MKPLSATIAQLRERIARRELSATALCEEVLATIERDDPRIRAMSDVVAATALKEAGEADRAAAARTSGGRLAGIPLAVKSNIDTLPAVCDAGLPQLHGRRPAADAEVVARLRGAGAVIVGTTATDSGGYGVTTPGVCNPVWPQHTAGGSSGGAAAAVAAGFCAAAIGTDTGGSVRIPAACCGVVGFKPTLGRVSTQGVLPLVPSVDHVGVLATSVADVASVLEVVDPAFAALPAWPGAAPPVIGVPTAYLDDAAPEVAGAFSAWIARCVDLGCTVRAVELPHPAETLATHLVLSLTEAALPHADDDAATAAALPEAARASIDLGLAYRGHEHLRALRQRAAFVAHMERALAQADVLALPTLRIAVPDRVTAARDGMLETLIRFTAPFNQGGHPALARPWRPSPGQVPASIQLVGRRNEDRQLLGLAQWLEQRVDGFATARLE